MSILSLEFIILVLATVIVYYIVPLKVRWIVLLVASGVFYAMAGWQGCIWLVAVAAITFLSSLLQQKLLKRQKDTEDIEMQIREAAAIKAQTSSVDAADRAAEAVAADAGSPAPDQSEALSPGTVSEKEDNPSASEAGIHSLPGLPTSGWFSSSRKIKKLRQILLAVSVILPFLAMAFSKYYVNFREWFSTLPALTLIVPLGLSYFTFQSVGYMVDVYRGKFPAEKNPLKYLLFLSFFPQMTQGPISPYPQLMPQLAEGHRFDPDNFVMGVQLALWGLFKKMVLADRLAEVTGAISDKQRGWFILLTVIIYAIRLYADFSGGMDLIRGAARMLGIDMVENFRRPFFSFSVAEYWRRWHISLGVWFRNYIFYPITTSGAGIRLSKIGRKLFGKKAGRAFPATVSTIIIFFLIGIWHTANANAVIYGLYFGLVMGIELLLEPAFKKLKKKLRVKEKSIPWKIFTLLRTWILIIIPQYFAFTSGPDVAFKLLGNTFRNWSFADTGAQFTDVMVALGWYIAAIAFVIILAVDIICEKVPDLNRRIASGPFIIRWVVILLLILAVLVFGRYGTGFDASAFLYTHF